jgi:YD repeat-containing protein
VTAVGYADGRVVLVRNDDGALILVRAPGGEPVSALGWDAAGQTLAFGNEAGEAGVLSL